MLSRSQTTASAKPPSHRYILTYIYIYMYVCMYVCMYYNIILIYIYIHTHMHTAYTYMYRERHACVNPTASGEGCLLSYQAQGHMLPIGLRLTLNRRKSRDPPTQNSQKAPLNHETLKPPTLKTQSPKPHNPRSIRRAKEKPSKTDLLAAHQRATQQGPEKVNYSAEPAEKSNTLMEAT